MAFRQGLLTNLRDPKCAVFLIVLVPRFLPAEPSAAGTLEPAAVRAVANVA
ncbi:hypothetical protein [Nocardia aurantiaca]|uniref:Uncharacterized protein n=1 Tax=Nocardia aurantiaca TaxID=2675850 RepID=A0A6I3L1A2_9NOCA|nr:hypothetical protein [Nocardia aurantiaca]MTE15038.1 hypothetical protein [Nocardia aurantiaca]